MITREGKLADDRGYRAMLRHTDGRTPGEDDIIDMIADVLLYGFVSHNAEPDDMVARVLAHVHAEIDGDDFTTPEPVVCPVCRDAMTGEHSNYTPTWSDIHDDVVCSWCARVTVHPAGTEWLTCDCGNDPRSDGFDTVDADGSVIEPNVWGTWDGLYRCDRCGRFHRIETEGDTE